MPARLLGTSAGARSDIWRRGVLRASRSLPGRMSVVIAGQVTATASPVSETMASTWAAQRSNASRTSPAYRARL